MRDTLKQATMVAVKRPAVHACEQELEAGRSRCLHDRLSLQPAPARQRRLGHASMAPPKPFLRAALWLRGQAAAMKRWLAAVWMNSLPRIKRDGRLDWPQPGGHGLSDDRHAAVMHAADAQSQPMAHHALPRSRCSFLLRRCSPCCGLALLLAHWPCSRRWPRWPRSSSACNTAEATLRQDARARRTDRSRRWKTMSPAPSRSTAHRSLSDPRPTCIAAAAAPQTPPAASQPSAEPDAAHQPALPARRCRAGSTARCTVLASSIAAERGRAAWTNVSRLGGAPRENRDATCLGGLHGRPQPGRPGRFRMPGRRTRPVWASLPLAQRSLQRP